mgnify:CR=1 FL=1
MCQHRLTQSRAGGVYCVLCGQQVAAVKPLSDNQRDLLYTALCDLVTALHGAVPPQARNEYVRADRLLMHIRDRRQS